MPVHNVKSSESIMQGITQPAHPQGTHIQLHWLCPHWSSWVGSGDKRTRWAQISLPALHFQECPHKLPGESPARSSPASCHVPLLPSNTHLCHSETTPKCQAYPCNPRKGPHLPLVPNLQVHWNITWHCFTGWCSHKTRTFTSPGKIPAGQKHDRCFRET